MKTIRIHHTTGTGYKDQDFLALGDPWRQYICVCDGRVFDYLESYMTADGELEIATYSCHRCQREIRTERLINRR